MVIIKWSRLIFQVHEKGEQLHIYMKQIRKRYIFLCPAAEFKDMVTLLQKRKCPLQKDLSIKFRVGFRFQYTALSFTKKFYNILIVLLILL